MFGLQGLILLLGTANAQTPPEETLGIADPRDVIINLTEIVGNLHEVNGNLKQELAELSEELDIHQDVLLQLSIIVNTRQEEETRIAAIHALNEIQKERPEEKILEFYWEILGETPGLSWAILDGLTMFSSSADIPALIQKGLYIENTESQSQTTVRLGRNLNFGLYAEKPAELDQELILKTIAVAGQLQQDEIAMLLVDFTKDLSVPFTLRQAAFVTVESNYAEFLDTNGRYELEKESNTLANQLYALSVGTTTSVLLGSVGVWGQSDISETLGYGGGMAMGVTGGYLYADQLYRPTMGQSALMASSVTWGIIEANVLSDSLDLNEEQAALSRTLGVLGGAGYGYWQRDREIAFSDVIELDFMGYWGAQMGVGLYDILGTSPRAISEPVYDNFYDYDDEEVDWDAADLAYYSAYEEYEQEVERLQNSRQQALLIGSVLGLGLGHQFTESWKVRPESLLFSGVYSTEFAAASALSIQAFDISDENAVGIVRTGTHGAMAGALLYDHFHPVTYEQSLFSAYGAGIGHLLGAGVPYLLKVDSQGVAHGMLWTGLLGTGAGTYIGNELEFTDSDWILTGVGSGLSAWHFLALSEITEGYELVDSDQSLGIFTTGLGLSGIGLVYAGTRGDISVEDSLFLGATTSWGAYYGGLLPVALDADLEPHEHLLVTLIASDIGLIGGSYGVFKAGYEPKRAVLPQFLGAAGATMGALGSFLFTEDPQTVTANTLGWGTLGIAGGVIWEKTKRKNGKTKELSLLPDLNGKLANNIRLQFAPQVDPDGNLGMYVGMYNRAF